MTDNRIQHIPCKVKCMTREGYQGAVFGYYRPDLDMIEMRNSRGNWGTLIDARPPWGVQYELLAPWERALVSSYHLPPLIEYPLVGARDRA